MGGAAGPWRRCTCPCRLWHLGQHQGQADRRALLGARPVRGAAVPQQDRDVGLRRRQRLAQQAGVQGVARGQQRSVVARAGGACGACGRCCATAIPAAALAWWASRTQARACLHGMWHGMMMGGLTAASTCKRARRCARTSRAACIGRQALTSTKPGMHLWHGHAHSGVGIVSPLRNRLASPPMQKGMGQPLAAGYAGHAERRVRKHADAMGRGYKWRSLGAGGPLFGSQSNTQKCTAPRICIILLLTRACS